MSTKIVFETKAVSCLLAQGGIQSPLRTFAIRIANAARLPDGSKVRL
jgi:hypothetical protein